LLLLQENDYFVANNNQSSQQFSSNKSQVVKSAQIKKLDHNITHDDDNPQTSTLLSRSISHSLLSTSPMESPQTSRAFRETLPVGFGYQRMSMTAIDSPQISRASTIALKSTSPTRNSSSRYRVSHN
jgi:hypothetical protein